MTAYSASIEWLCDHAGVLRVHPGPGGVVGDPYAWCATIARRGDRAEVKGVCRPIPRRALRPALDALAAAGIVVLRRRRARGDSARVLDRPTRRPGR